MFVAVSEETDEQKSGLATTGYLMSTDECVGDGLLSNNFTSIPSPWEDLPSSPETFGVISYDFCDEINHKSIPLQQPASLTDTVFSQTMVASGLYSTSSLESSSDCAAVPECELSSYDMLLDLDEAMNDVIMDPLELAEIGLYLPPVSADDVESVLSSPTVVSTAPPVAVPVCLETGPSVTTSDFPVYCEEISVASPLKSEKELSSVTANCLLMYEEQDQLPSPASSRSSISSPPPDKKRRKKEQNKTAAQKYRQKKRGEEGMVMTEYEQLERRNIELHTRVEEMTREVDYLKGLIEEICA